MRALLLLALVGCTPKPMPLSPTHPANPEAPVGRLAGPPAALRPGVGSNAAPPPASESVPDDKPAPQGHEGHH